MATIYRKPRRNGIWWISYYLDGKRKSESLKTRNRNEAKAVKAEIESRLNRNEYIVQDQHINLEQFTDNYLLYLKSTLGASTYKRYEISVRNFLDFVKSKNLIYLLSVTHEDIDSFVSMRAINRSPKTVNEDLRLVKNLFDRAIAYKYLRHNPAQNVKRLKYIPKPPKYFTADELKKIYNASSQRHNLIWRFLFKTGLRRGELFNLEWSDIDFDVKLIKIQPKDFWKPKNSQPRNLPMTNEVNDILRERKQLNESDRWVFSTPGGAQYTALRRTFIETLAKINVNGTLHTFRHTFASHLVMQGVSLAVVQKLLGHSTITMTMKYAHLAPDHLAEEIKVLDEIL